MAASDNLQPALFHGTAHWFQPGETVEPRFDWLYGKGNVTWATTNIQVAANVSRSRATPSRVSRPSQGVLFSPVFEVEHLDESESARTPSDSTVSSSQGFRVKRIAGYARGANFDDSPYDGATLM